jgi:putative ABC transport system permease protein
MTRFGLILKSARYHWRANLGAVFAAAAGCAVLVGALIVGDSVRYTLHTMAVERLGTTEVALIGQDHFFKADLSERMRRLVGDVNEAGFFNYDPMLLIPGVCATDKNKLRANDVQVCGITGAFFDSELQSGEGIINEKLAQLLLAQPGDTLRVRIYKPGVLPNDAPLSGRDDQAVFLRVKIRSVIPSRGLGRFSLQGNQTVPANLFVPIADIQETLEQKGRANLLLLSYANGVPRPEAEKSAAKVLEKAWTLDDAQLKMRIDREHDFAELTTPRVFLDDALTDNLLKEKDSSGIATYFINAIRANGKETPYSMVTGATAPLVDADLKDDEIVLNQWTADDLGAKIGDAVELEYYVVGLLRKMETKKAAFKVKAIVPIEGLRADRSLMPDFPGIADVDSTHDWKAGVDIDMKKIRPKDEEYWKKYRGIPKAFISLKRATALWHNRFGTYTAVRFPYASMALKPLDMQQFSQLTRNILQFARPDKLGMPLLPVKEMALKGVEQSMDFGGLFLGLSFFLIAAALLLMALIFQFGVESRARETGVLLALGFRVRSVRFLLWGEGLAAAALGVPVGVAGGVLYAHFLIASLSTRWQGAVGGAALDYHAEPLSIVIGCVSSIAAAALAIFFAVRKQAARPARELLASRGSATRPASTKITGWKIAGIVGLFSAGFMIALGFKSSGEEAAGYFFGSGAMLLIFALALIRWLLVEPPTSHTDAAPSLFALGLRAARRKPGRSLAAVALLASGAFLVSAIGVNELDAAAGANSKNSGTGGFALFGRSTIPVFNDLNDTSLNGGREKAGVPDKGLENTSIYPLRVKSGDEASCLNLNRAQRPRILGVPEAFMKRGGFTFSKTQVVLKENENPWLVALNNGKPTDPSAPIPAVCDEQSMQWALGLGLGDTLDIQDEHGHPRKLKLVGALANSILQGSILIAEDEFMSLFPSESGYQYFLIDTPEKDAANVSKLLADALSDSGFEGQSAVSRLAEYNAVQNTYLTTFQALGALGLLLGSLGLGIVVLRNLLDRRAEIAMLRAIGFSRFNLAVMILAEHAWLMLMGLFAGVFAALIAIAPTLKSVADVFKWRSMHWMLLAIVATGLSSMLLAAWSALRAPVLDGLKSDV